MVLFTKRLCRASVCPEAVQNSRSMPCRTLVTQRFLQGVELNSQQRTEKMDAVLKALRPKRRKLTKEEADLFYARLQADSERRKRSRCAASSIWKSCCSSLCRCICKQTTIIMSLARLLQTTTIMSLARLLVL